jgi:hypothetical protein
MATTCVLSWQHILLQQKFNAPRGLRSFLITATNAEKEIKKMNICLYNSKKKKKWRTKLPKCCVCVCVCVCVLCLLKCNILISVTRNYVSTLLVFGRTCQSMKHIVCFCDIFVHKLLGQI